MRRPVWTPMSMTTRAARNACMERNPSRNSGFSKRPSSSMTRSAYSAGRDRPRPVGQEQRADLGEVRAALRPRALGCLLPFEPLGFRPRPCVRLIEIEVGAEHGLSPDAVALVADPFVLRRFGHVVVTDPPGQPPVGGIRLGPGLLQSIGQRGVAVVAGRNGAEPAPTSAPGPRRQLL